LAYRITSTQQGRVPAMLSLTRRIGESIIIGGDISVTVLDIKRTQIRIGVNAPRDLSVDRQEVRERKSGDNPMGKNTGLSP
jgi:carbon storage regulator